MVEMKTDDLEKQLGLNLASRRKALGWTQDFVAQQISVETETISRIERGVSTPSLKTLARLADLLSINLSDLFADSILLEKPSDIEALALTLECLHPDDRHFVIQSMRLQAKHIDSIRKTGH